MMKNILSIYIMWVSNKSQYNASGQFVPVMKQEYIAVLLLCICLCKKEYLSVCTNTKIPEELSPWSCPPTCTQFPSSPAGAVVVLSPPPSTASAIGIHGNHGRGQHTYVLIRLKLCPEKAEWIYYNSSLHLHILYWGQCPSPFSTNRSFPECFVCWAPGWISPAPTGLHPPAATHSSPWQNTVYPQDSIGSV